MDMSLVSQEAATIHGIFLSAFYTLATVLLLLGIVIDYFRLPIGGVPSFPQLLGRTLVAFLLLASYSEIANTIGTVSDALASEVGDLNSYHLLLSRAGEALKTLSWSWSSMADTFIFVISYLAFYLLHITVFFFDAAVAYAWVVMYVFSPVLIALFILPQTAVATSALFRSLLEVAGWKVTWSVMGTLLWSSAIHNFENVDGQTNVITLVTYTVILSLSLILTPMVFRALIGNGVASLASNVAGAAGSALVAASVGPASLSALATAPARHAVKGATGLVTKPALHAKNFLLARKETPGDLSTRTPRFSRNKRGRTL